MRNKKSRNWNKFFLRIILPAIVSIILFVTSFFLIIIPAFEENIIERKREMTRELTNSAWSILEKHYNDELDSLVTRECAQKEAIEEIKHLRYGEERKDYFWITDMHPNMIMHPYRVDLDGTSLENFQDAHGKKLFVEFVNIVNREEEGYLDYMWQWKDDSSRIVPKLSFVKEFKPWGWIIGTGIYTEDVKMEISRIESRVIKISLMITFLISLLLAVNMRQSLKIERKRLKAESELKTSRERYRALVEASTEGSMMVLDNYIYANKYMLDLLGYEESEVSLLNVFDIISDEQMRKEMPGFNELVFNLEHPRKYETKLRTKSGELIDVIMNVSKINIAERDAVIFITKSLSMDTLSGKDSEMNKLKRITEGIKIGLFKCVLARKSLFIDSNDITPKLFGLATKDELLRTNIGDLFSDPDEQRSFVKELIFKGIIRNRILKIIKHDKTIAYINVSLFVIKDNEVRYCDGLVEDVTEEVISKKATDAIMKGYQASQSVIYQPLKKFLGQALQCGPKTSIRDAAELMKENKTCRLLIRENRDDIKGLITEKDILNILINKEMDSDISVSEIMKTPVFAIPDKSLLYEAIFALSKTDEKYVLVKDESGAVRNVITSEEVLKALNFVPELLTEKIQHAKSVEELEMIQKELKIITIQLVESGSTPGIITRFISSVSDSIIEKLNQLAGIELGPPPVSYSFITLGSVGREEQTLATDQDNAIIYEDVSPESEKEVNAYFLKMGTIICNNLDKIGYSFCKGNIMAKNPKFCKPISVWKEYFSEWVTKNEAADLLDVNIFFDFRFSFGSIELADDLKNHVRQITKNNSTFFYHLALNTMSYKAPLNFFGNIINEQKDNRIKIFDIKKAIMPIIGFARLYGLKNNLETCNTISRLDGLYNINIIRRSEYEKVKQMFDYLMTLRFMHQVDQLNKDIPPDNYINQIMLTDLDLVIIKKIFAQMGSFQTRLSYDFRGTAV